MTDNEKIKEIEEIMDVEDNSLKPEDELDNFDEWDSMTKLALIASSQKVFGKEITGSQLKDCKTVSDLLKL